MLLLELPIIELSDPLLLADLASSDLVFQFPDMLQHDEQQPYYKRESVSEAKSDGDDADDVLLLRRLFFCLLLCFRFLSSESEELQLELLSEE
ncbi:hypothetical protein ABZP36_001276 [Zizania latifolia]